MDGESGEPTKFVHSSSRALISGYDEKVVGVIQIHPMATYGFSKRVGI